MPCPCSFYGITVSFPVTLGGRYGNPAHGVILVRNLCRVENDLYSSFYTKMYDTSAEILTAVNPGSP
jgi:hypothetical protein